ncbi:putative HTH-type transcriptional regulator YsmB [Caldalkalibacillus thermarum]|uniref:MarR family winged helix-turn-helix transcriptional regulator n=1 Tax=Caldalkalibacillus thermarum TaxID=296745 RepID=UPI00166758F9|nr:MarR family transcriptional regulator [Caldalkalibacillus thermarum]GGK30513.1 putative HTH-type transcriptional regulator YsmB [Caldalkalibacillus thermarum]
MEKKTTPYTEEQVFEIERELRYISSIIKQKGREILADFPITPPQFVALQWLNEEGDMTIGELSNKMYLACSTTTDLVDRMESNGLVERVRDTNDRRVVRIHLKEKGKNIILDVLKARREYLASILSNFSQEQVAELARSLELLHNEMKQERENV